MISSDVLDNVLRAFEGSIHRPWHILFDIMLFEASFATLVTIGSVKDPHLFGINGGVWQVIFCFGVFFSLGKLIYDSIRFCYGKKVTRQDVLDYLLREAKQK